MKRFIVFGANGFIGSNSVDQLSLRNQVLAVDRFSSEPLFVVNKNTEMIKIDLSQESKKLIELSKDPSVDGVVWAVGDIIPNEKQVNYDQILDFSIHSTKVLISYIQRKIPLVFLSSAGMLYEQGEKATEQNKVNPWTWYGLQKLMQEKGLLFSSREFENPKVRIIRISSVYGERQNLEKDQGVVGKIIKDAILGEEFQLYGSELSRRDFIYVKDLAKIVEQLLHNDFKHQIYNVSTNKSHSIKEVIELVEKISKKKLVIKKLKGRKSDPEHIDISSDLLLKEIPEFEFTNLKDGLKLTYDYISKRI